MHVILTHEQADFDALASLLGAHFLHPQAHPVLPRKMNRNVHAFLTLYGGELPFIDPRDLPSAPIDKVTLVDTQSLISLKGMKPDAEVHVIDHHPLREDLPSDWRITVAATGANATILTESLRNSGSVLTTVQATLLLLGIYEDTGSLTYTRTTSRDLQAASYLLDQGASLRIAAEFLNHPLSKAQQNLYDELRANAESLDIHGYVVVLARGDARDLNEELSTIAHKMRDLLDPDALFLIIATRGGVQLIARSTSDHIDVAALVGHFGGGGHERAAAGLVKDRELDTVYAELVELLPKYVKPAITVSQIMSRGPQTVSPETPVGEVARRMQRYGYEGYPVVEDGKTVGLLTRRAVDRALSHQLNLTAGSLMDAGEYSVAPDDPIESLQRLMTESGWGQIPVIDTENGQIVGIVTRTDLLKTLTSEQKEARRQSLAARLESALPQARLTLLKAIAEQSHRLGLALYIVGGFVRDLILETPSLDFDLVVEGDAIQLARSLAQRFGGRVTSHTQFGTAKWLIGAETTFKPNPIFSAQGVHFEDDLPGMLPDSIDFVSARREFYTYPTALPTVERGSIKLDLHRRDFTINTLALRLDGNHYGDLHDYWGGLSDLRRKIVRVLHSLSFVDDPTRILRAVRFEQRFDFRIGTRTLDLMHEALPLLDRVSGDRIRHELDAILDESRRVRMISRLEDLGVLTAIHPGLVWGAWIEAKFDLLFGKELGEPWFVNQEPMDEKNQRDLGYALWLLRCSQEIAVLIVKRLKLKAVVRDIVLAANKIWQFRSELIGAPPSRVVRRLLDRPLPAIFVVYLGADDGVLKETLYRYAQEWRCVSPNTDGNDLRKRGLPPGPVYRDILSSLRDAWLDGHIHTYEEEMQALESMLEAHSWNDQSRSG